RGEGHPRFEASPRDAAPPSPACAAIRGRSIARCFGPAHCGPAAEGERYPHSIQKQTEARLGAPGRAVPRPNFGHDRSCEVASGGDDLIFGRAETAFRSTDPTVQKVADS